METYTNSSMHYQNSSDKSKTLHALESVIIYFLRRISVVLKKCWVGKLYRFNVNQKCAVIRSENKFCTFLKNIIAESLFTLKKLVYKTSSLSLFYSC